MLRACALFEPELRLAVGAADISVSLEVAHLHILALEEIRNRCADDEISVVLIQALVDVCGQGAEHRKSYQQKYHDHHDRTADEQIDEIQRAREYPYQRIQFIVAVTAAHELGGLHQKFTHVITETFKKYR